MRKLFLVGGLMASLHGCAETKKVLDPTLEARLATATYGALASAMLAKTNSCAERLVINGKPTEDCVMPNGGVKKCATVNTVPLCSSLP